MFYYVDYPPDHSVYYVKNSAGQILATRTEKEKAVALANQLNAYDESHSPQPPSFYSNLDSNSSASSASTPMTVSLSDEQLSTIDESFNQLQTALSQIQQGQDYATQVMDQAVSAGLEHQKWVEQQQESLLQAYPKAFEALTPKTEGLMEAGTAELMRAQKSAMHTVTSSLAARGLLGSSAAESAYAKIAGETATKIGSLAADTQNQLIQTQAARESAYLQAMNQLLSIPTLQGYAELATAGANASLFAIPTGGF